MFGKILGSTLNIVVNTAEIALKPIEVLLDVTDEAVSEVAKNINEFIDD